MLGKIRLVGYCSVIKDHNTMVSIITVAFNRRAMFKNTLGSAINFEG